MEQMDRPGGGAGGRSGAWGPSGLGALSGLAAQHDGDDVAAAAALAWLLVPGACLLANRLATLSPVVDELVAAQLWIQARTFGPGGGRRVAASILG